MIPRFMVVFPAITSVVVAVVETGAGSVDIWGPLAGQGALGLVLAWMLVRTDARMRRMEEEIHVSNKAVLLAVISMDGAAEYVKKQAEGMLRQLEVSEESNRTK